MTIANSQFLNVFKYETTPGTDIITIATDQTYKFGLYPDQSKIDLNSMKANIQQIVNWASRQAASQAVASWDFPQKVLTYYPTTAQALHRLLGTATSGSPNLITVKDTGLPHSFTWRQEHYGGTNPHRRQMRGCFTTGLEVDFAYESPLQFKESINYWGMKDQGDYVALTTAPAFPASEASPFSGIAVATYKGSNIPWLRKRGS